MIENSSVLRIIIRLVTSFLRLGCRNRPSYLPPLFSNKKKFAPFSSTHNTTLTKHTAIFAKLGLLYCCTGQGLVMNEPNFHILFQAPLQAFEFKACCTTFYSLGLLMMRVWVHPPFCLRANFQKASAIHNFWPDFSRETPSLSSEERILTV